MDLLDCMPFTFAKNWKTTFLQLVASPMIEVVEMPEVDYALVIEVNVN